MEKVKNILSGKDKDDEKTYQSGHNTSTATLSTAPTTGNLSGQGSHLGGETRTGMTGVTDSQVSSHMPAEHPTGAAAAGYSTASTQHGDGRVPTTTAGPHSSNITNKANPRVDSDLDNSRTVGSTGTHNSTQGTGYGSGIGSTGIRSTGASSTIAGSHSSNLANKADPRVDSDLDGTRTAGYSGTSGANTGSAAIGSTTTVRSFPLGSSTDSTNAGPHSSNIANQADPRVDSDQGGSRTAGNTASTAAIGSTTIAQSFPLGGAGSSTTSGLHSSDLTDAADPSVGSDNSRLTGTSESTMNRSYPIHSGSGNNGITSTGHGTSTTCNTSTTTGSGNHIGRDAAKVGTTAAVREGVHHHNQQSNLGSTTASSDTGSRGFHTTSGPHQTDTANRLDPHVASGVGREDAIHHHEKRGGGSEEADSSHRNIGTTSANATRIGDTNLADRTTGGSSHTGRNAALGTAAGAAAGGLAAHEFNSRHGGQTSALGNTSGTTGTGLSPGTTSGNTYSKDQTSALDNTSGNTGTGLPSGIPRDPAGNSYGRDTTTTDTSSHHGRDAALGTATGFGAAGLAKQYDNRHPGQTSGFGNTSSTGHSLTQPTTDDYSSTGNNYGTTTGSSSHHGRDAALGAGAAGLAKHEHDNRYTGQASGLGNTSTTDHSTAQPTTGDYSNTSSSHHGRDAALGAGAGAGVAGAAGYAMHEHGKNRTKGEPTTTGTTTTTTTTTESKHHGHHKDHKDHDTKDRDNKFSLFSHHDRDRNTTADSATTHHDRDRNTGVGDTTSHHTRRDTALGGTTAGAAGARDLTLDGQDHHVATEGGFDQDGNPINGSSNLAHAKDGTKAGHGESNPATAMYVREAQKVEEKNHGSGSYGHDKLGEHLHGQRQSGVVGSSGFPGQPGFGDGHVPGPHETTGRATTGVHYGQSTSSAVRAGGPSEYEHDTSRSGGNYTTSSSHIGASDASSAPRNLSEGVFDQAGKPIASHGIPAAYGAGDKTATGSDGHTRLHKDPPAGHPAS